MAKNILTFDEVGRGLNIKDGDKLYEFAIAGLTKNGYGPMQKSLGKIRSRCHRQGFPNQRLFAMHLTPTQNFLILQTIRGCPRRRFVLTIGPIRQRGKVTNSGIND